MAIYIYINADVHEWTRLVESCMIFPLQPQYLEQCHTVINQKRTFSHPPPQKKKKKKKPKKKKTKNKKKKTTQIIL